VGKGKKRQAALSGVVSDPSALSFDLNLSDSPSAVWASTLSMGTTGLPWVDETSAMTVVPYARGESLIATTIAGLPWRAYEKNVDDTRRAVVSFIDNPQGPTDAISRYQFVETLVIHLVRYREAYLRHMTNGAGAFVGFQLIHPTIVTKVAWRGLEKDFTVRGSTQPLALIDGQSNDEQIFSTDGPPGERMTQILGPSSYGLRGIPIYVQHARLFQIALAADKATGRGFTGALARGFITTEDGEDMEKEEMQAVVDSLNTRLTGVDNTGQFAAVNRHLKFTEFTVSNVDSQFIETKGYQDGLFATILGLPPHLLGQIEKQTSWGTGVAEQNIGLHRYTLKGYTDRISSIINVLQPDGQYNEFDYKGLLEGSPSEDIALLNSEVASGILTVDEARAYLNLGPKPEVPVTQGVPANG
jgi:HK97 family phage portal protein